MDRTIHLEDAHLFPIKPKTAQWYKSFGDKCPVCSALADSDTRLEIKDEDN